MMSDEMMSVDAYRKAFGHSKYKAVPTVVDGVRFDSKMEARRYEDLRLLERAGEIRDLELQTRYPLVVNGVKVCVYVADFTYVETMTGEKVTEDVKGVRNSTYKLKRALMKAVYGITIKETSA